MGFHIIPIVATVLVVVVFSFYYKGKKKVDDGFKLNYYGLSYRRKMLRTIYTSPIIIFAVIIIHFMTDFSVLQEIGLIMIFVGADAIQLLYNYYMWKKKEA